MQLTIDLHTHTRHSPSCGWMPPERLIDTAKGTLDGVAVTDHNTTSGVQAAIDAAPEELLVIPGEEVDTQTGQVIGLFLQSEIESGRPAAAVVEEIHDQDGIAFAPHPFDTFRKNLTDIETHASELDAIETINSRCVRRAFNDRAASFAIRHDLAAFGGSDAHLPNEVGNARTAVDVDAESTADKDTLLRAVREALRDGRTRPVGRRGSVLNHVGTKLVKSYRAYR